MKPADIQQIGQELAIKWDNGTESYIRFEQLRRGCPCAGCKGETDILGNTHMAPPKPLSPQSFVLRSIQNVGGYGLQPVWADGHSTGIYPFAYLQRLGEAG